jgi:hypothetical protein
LSLRYLPKTAAEMIGAVLPRLLWRRSPNVSTRSGARVRLVVAHRTEGAYGGAIAWLCQSRAQASAHAVLREDGSEATQLVEWGEKAWAVCAYNSISDSLEMAGSGSSYQVNELRVGARIMAFRLHERRLPARWARFGIGAGYCRHKDLGATGGGHVDPVMTPAQWKLFQFFIKLEAARGGFRPAWGR